MAFTLAHGRRAARHHLSAEPNVIPFIDVLLVLLIIFMVTAPKPTVDLQIDLPRRTIPLQVLIPPIIVDLREDASGYRLLVDERDVAIEALTSTVLAQVLAVDPVLTRDDAFTEARIYVRADQGWLTATWLQ